MRLSSSSSFQGSENLDAKEVLQQEIPWQTYMTAKLINPQELELIKRFDKQLPEVQDSLLDQAGPAYFEAFMTVLRATTKEGVVRYVLALLDDVVTRDPSRAALCHPHREAFSDRGQPPYTVFLRHLNRTDWFTQEKACRMLTALIAHRPDKERSPLTTGEKFVPAVESGSFVETGETAVVQFLEWLTSQLRRPTSQLKSVPTAVHALASVLRERGTRLLFHREGGVALLAPLLRLAAQGQVTNIQLTYEAVLCVWLLSYLPECQKAIQDCGIPRSLVGIVGLNIKEKVTRVALFALRNILASEKVDISTEVVDSKFLRLVQIRMLQSWGDEDILPTLEWLDEKIRSSIEILSSYEKYKKEILSGRLEWGPMHTEDQFWKQNVEKFEEKDFNILRVLLRLLEISREVKTLAVGCHDLGQFVSYHPHGRFIVGDLRGKEIVMELMRHSDPEVQKNALLCVQKIMLSRDKLDFLTAAS